ncbi:MAG: hypothetical protein K2G30_02100, partial [Muribaculaceae bacterium]|nr:hypothetical protein [Muribaculaceae bacterium]
ADQTAVDGQWVLTPGDYSSSSIYAKDGYLLRGVTDGSGAPLSVYGGYVSIYAGNYTASQTFTIDSCPEEEVRTASFTVEVDGNPSYVSLQRSSDYATIALTEASTAIRFDPANETSYSVGHAGYGMQLYSVEVNGVAAQSQAGRFYLTVSDGDVVKVTTDFPDRDVPVSFTFTNEGTEGVVTGVMVGGMSVSGWNEDGFTVKLGSTLAVQTNTTDFENISATLNGQAISSYYYSTTVANEEPLNFVYTATKVAPMRVTVEAVNPEGIRIDKGYTGESYTLTGELTVLEVPKSTPYIIVKAVDGYVIAAIEDDGGNTYSSNSSIYVSDGMQLTVVAEEFVRDNRLTVYVGDGGWQYRSLTLSEGKETRLLYSDGGLPVGYSEIAFSDIDLPINLSGYPALYVYHNGEAVEAPQYGTPLIAVAADGDVVKMFCAEPETYGVTYDIAAGIDVEVRHDRTLVVANPSVHSVIGATEIRIAAVDGLARTTVAPLVVTVNDVPVTADNSGAYVAIVDCDTEVKVTADETSGIDGIRGDAAPDTRVLNLQGIQVGTADDTSGLPAGVYIAGGRKVRL